MSFLRLIIEEKLYVKDPGYMNAETRRPTVVLTEGTRRTNPHSNRLCLPWQQAVIVQSYHLHEFHHWCLDTRVLHVWGGDVTGVRVTRGERVYLRVCGRDAKLAQRHTTTIRELHVS